MSELLDKILCFTSTKKAREGIAKKIQIKKN